jgi:hypothetical protein
MGYKQFRKRTPPSTEMMSREVKIYLPKSLYDILKAKSEKTGLPMSRLASFAIDNEIVDQGIDAAFEYDCKMPENTYVEGAYVDEGSRIYRYLTRNGSPMSVDQMILHRRDIGVPEKLTLLLGLRELLERGTLVEEIYPTWSHFKFRDTYRVIAVKTEAKDKKKKEIEKAERHLAKLKGKPYGGPLGTETSDSEDTEE